MSILLKDLDTTIINYCDVETDYKNIILINKYYNNIITNDNLFLDFKKIIKMKIKMLDKKKLFIETCRMDFKFFAKYLISKHKINIHTDDELAFRWSCRNGHIETVKYLVELGNQPNYQQINIHANTEEAFRWSCRNGHIETVKYLIELGTQPNYQKINIHANDEEAFRYSCYNGHIETTIYLIEISNEPGMIPFSNDLIERYYPKN